MIILFTAFLIGIVVAVFTFQIHGYASAIMLAIGTIGFDILWQWLRFKILTRKTKSFDDGQAKILPGIIAGFGLRIISMIAFLKLGSWWLPRNEFFAFAIMLLTLPFWNKLAAYKFKSVI